MAKKSNNWIGGGGWGSWRGWDRGWGIGL